MSHPLLYELNTRCWLRSLSARQGREITLAGVPDSEFQRWQQIGFTHIWAMGVWTTGPRCRALALAEPHLRKALSDIAPGWREQDVLGSPFAIAEYRVPESLGGEAGLAAFRGKLNEHGLKLLLDFVPNHVGLDHRWVTERPDLFVQAGTKAPGTFPQKTDAGLRVLAHGRDPNFPPWADTVQLDYRRAETRAAMTELLLSIARRCDGVRCDLAMLLLNDVFARTWANYPGAGDRPKTEYWAEAIASVRQARPDFVFLAEVYWGMEARLQALGFDYTYDKTFYDLLVGRRGADLQERLLNAASDYLDRSVHFLENHDERRIATVLSLAEHRAAALLMLGLPGMRFLYEGQLDGWRTSVPIQYGLWPDQPANPDIQNMYERMLAALKDSAVGRGKWKLLRPESCPDNPGARDFVFVQWQSEAEWFDLVAVNLASRPAQVRVRLSVEGLAAFDWEMRDLLGDGIQQHSGSNLQTEGLAVESQANGAQLGRFIRKERI